MIKFLTHRQAIFLNGMVIKRYSPDEMIGVKDEKMLDSALMRPQPSAFGEDEYPSLTEKAAALYASLAQNHAFQNATKRTAFACLHQFLWINGYKLQIAEEEAEDYTVYVVNKKPPISLISNWIREHTSERHNV